MRKILLLSFTILPLSFNPGFSAEAVDKQATSDTASEDTQTNKTSNETIKTENTSDSDKISEDTQVFEVVNPPYDQYVGTLNPDIFFHSNPTAAGFKVLLFITPQLTSSVNFITKIASMQTNENTIDMTNFVTNNKQEVTGQFMLKVLETTKISPALKDAMKNLANIFIKEPELFRQTKLALQEIKASLPFMKDDFNLDNSIFVQLIINQRNGTAELDISPSELAALIKITNAANIIQEAENKSVKSKTSAEKAQKNAGADYEIYLQCEETIKELKAKLDETGQSVANLIKDKDEKTAKIQQLTTENQQALTTNDKITAIIAKLEPMPTKSISIFRKEVAPIIQEAADAKLIASTESNTLTTTLASLPTSKRAEFTNQFKSSLEKNKTTSEKITANETEIAKWQAEAQQIQTEIDKIKPIEEQLVEKSKRREELANTSAVQKAIRKAQELGDKLALIEKEKQEKLKTLVAADQSTVK